LVGNSQKPFEGHDDTNEPSKGAGNHFGSCSVGSNTATQK